MKITSVFLTSIISLLLGALAFADNHKVSCNDLNVFVVNRSSHPYLIKIEKIKYGKVSRDFGSPNIASLGFATAVFSAWSFHGPDAIISFMDEKNPDAIVRINVQQNDSFLASGDIHTNIIAGNDRVDNIVLQHGSYKNTPGIVTIYLK